jgi:hypothetical protein
MSPRPFNNLTGRRFGEGGCLLVIGYAGSCDKWHQRRWMVKCSLCGKSKPMYAAVLLNHNPKSCGCARDNRASMRMRTLYFVAQKLGPEAMAGFARLQTADRVNEIFDVALSAVKQSNGSNGTHDDS